MTHSEGIMELSVDVTHGDGWGYRLHDLEDGVIQIQPIEWDTEARQNTTTGEPFLMSTLVLDKVIEALTLLKTNLERREAEESDD